MRLPDDFDDEDNSSMGLPMVQMVIGAAVFILLLFGIILAVNYKNNNHGTSQSHVTRYSQNLISIYRTNR